MSIAPVVATVEVQATPARAFELFTSRMGDWWVGGTVGSKPYVAIVVEPQVDGRWYERDADDAEAQWGKVLLWESPTRIILGWQLDSNFRYDSMMLTEVELTFTALDGGGTRVRLEHRNLERYGSDGARVAGLVDSGWAKQLGGFGSFAEQQETVHG